MFDLNHLLQKLESYRGMQKGWDSYKADPPNDTSIENARQFLELCNDFLPNRVVPTCMGGIAMTWKDEGDKVFIEFYNTGKAYYLYDDGDEDMLVREVTDYSIGIKQIKSLLKDESHG